MRRLSARSPSPERAEPAEPRGNASRWSCGFVLLAWLVAPGAMAAGGKPEKADRDTIKLVEFFVKAPTQDLPPEAVPHFLEVSTASLPARLVPRYTAKRLELLAILKLADGRRKGATKWLNAEPLRSCGDPDPVTPKALEFLKMMGFAEYREDQVNYLVKETDCTVCELRTEFSLTVVELPAKKKGSPPHVLYLFKDGDPILALLAFYESGTRQRNTAFFGIGATPKCRH